MYKVSLSGGSRRWTPARASFRAARWSSPPARRPVPWAFPARNRSLEKGVHYCAACDGAPYRGKTVAVVGGGNSAAADALTLSRIAKKVYLIHRRDSLRATKVYHEPLMNAPNVEFCWNSTVSALLHESRLTGLRLKDVNTGAERDLACDGVFISVGRAPATELFRKRAGAGQVRLHHGGRIHPHQPPRRVRRGRRAHQGRCGRWSPPYRTARWLSTTQRNIWRGIGKGAANDPLIGSSCPQATRLRALPHRGAG